jgi:Na+/H+ antiporter NhaD/arsenite permease-like protein
LIFERSGVSPAFFDNKKMESKGIGKISWLAKKELVLILFILLLVLLAIIYPEKITEYPSYVDWDTIVALTGLLIIATGLKESGYFNLISKKTLRRVKSERSLSLYLILLSVVLSTFLTNDITLFIVIPLTLSFQNLVKNDLTKLIIFEAIAVNVGSTLTPIGNPQNIYLWHMWNVSFAGFILRMLPVVSVLVVILLLFVRLVFSDREIRFNRKSNKDTLQKKSLFSISLVMLIVFVISFELRYVQILLPVVFAVFLVSFRKVLLKVDWLLILLFMVIFVDFHVISEMRVVSEAMRNLNLAASGNVFLFSGTISQFISNVPAGVFMSKYSHDWLAIVLGVNIGGNGLVIASLANVIALRMANNKKIWLTFHKYSIPYMVVTGAVTYLLFYV